MPTKRVSRSSKSGKICSTSNKSKIEGDVDDERKSPAKKGKGFTPVKEQRVTKNEKDE